MGLNIANEMQEWIKLNAVCDLDVFIFCRLNDSETRATTVSI